MLSHRLSRYRIGLVACEDINLTVADEFLRTVGGIYHHFRRIFGRCDINSLYLYSVHQISCYDLPFNESEAGYLWCIGQMQCYCFCFQLKTVRDLVYDIIVASCRIGIGVRIGIWVRIGIGIGVGIKISALNICKFIPLISGSVGIYALCRNASPATSLSLSARLNASVQTFLLSFCSKLRGLGPCATPPPRHTGL